MKKGNVTKLLVYTLLLSAVVGCCGVDEDTVSVNGYDDTCTEISTFIKDIEIVPLDKEHPVSYISKVAVFDSSLMVLARNGLFMFDSQGGFIRDLTHYGRGPGEWIQAASFAKNGSLITIFDGALGKIVAYSFQGDYVGSKSVPDMALGNLYDAEYLSESCLFVANLIYEDDNNVFCVYDEDSHVKTELLSSPVTCDKGAVPTGTHPFCKSDDKVLMVMPRSNVIYQYENGGVVPIYEVRTKQRVLSAKKLAAITDFMPYVVDGKSFPGFSSIFETENYLVLGFYGMSTTFIDKTTNKAMTIPTAEADFPIFTLSTQSGNKIIAVLSDIELQLFMMSYSPEQGSKYSQLYESINTYVNEGYDTFLVSYEVK